MGDITIDHEKCDGCAECLSVCPNDVFDLNGEGQSDAVNVDDCDDCCSCVEACPNEAILNAACE
ncbi:MAG: ferredoxin family protein [Archaeoglobaceae archaeon]